MSEKQNEPTTTQIDENNTTPEVTIPQENLPKTQTPAIPEQETFKSTEDNVPPPIPPSHSTSHGHQQKPKNVKTALIALLTICLLTGSLIGYAATYSMFNDKIYDLQNQLFDVQNQMYTLQLNNSNSNNAAEIFSVLYSKVRESIVDIQCFVPYYNEYGYKIGDGSRTGSGFVTNVRGQQVIVTNNHVINACINITVTFADGSSYVATVLGADMYSDLAILKVKNMPSGIPSLTIANSSNITIGDAVFAVGSPCGLSGTLTTGTISATGRTVDATINNQKIYNLDITVPDVIQHTAEINPGNSGGPLINLQGQVIGINTWIMLLYFGGSADGLGFAVPSDTILREIDALMTKGKYTQHPSLNATGKDMTLQIAKSMNIDITYGWLVETVPENSNLQSKDIIIKAGDTQINNRDDLLTYLVRNTLPGQNVEFTIIRDRQQQTITVEIYTLS